MSIPFLTFFDLFYKKIANPLKPTFLSLFSLIDDKIIEDISQ